ncbi:hypothetical protein PLICRDRAFT_169809 [Plicaturopsis crispa FD-325 SS-3]|nr:hypothetical protein PLICRDRAFT_169809 [Plicaturopsis crispa FD-325 SS-3]
MSPQPSHKSMSYRKPVPKYIPSPPPSPPSSPSFDVKMPSSLDYMLPSEWRDILERALSRDSWTRRSITVDDGIAARPISYACGSTYQPTAPSVVTQPNRKRTLSQVTRSPSPPMPVHYKRRRPDDVRLSLPFFIPGYIIYPDLISKQGGPHSRCHTPIEPRLSISMRGVSTSTGGHPEKTRPDASSESISSWCLSLAGSRSTVSDLPALPSYNVPQDTAHRYLSKAREIRGRIGTWLRLFAAKTRLLVETIFSA